MNKKSKKILISIKPTWCNLILNNEKIIELRKSVPNFKEPCEVYIYCTKENPRLEILTKNDYRSLLEKLNENKKSINKELKAHNKITYLNEEGGLGYLANGYVVGKFRFIKYLQFQIRNNELFTVDDQGEEFKQDINLFTNLSRVSFNDLVKYKGNSKYVYGWVIEDVEIFDKPLPLTKFGLSKAPQSWQYI